MLIVPLVDIIYGEPLSVWFLIAGEVLVFSGLLVGRFKAPPLTSLEAFTVGALAWVSNSIIGGIVLHLETQVPLLDTFFESVSGFTGTGFTVFRLQGMKHSIIFWRSLMQWTGELGFVVFAVVLIPYFYQVAKTLYGIERPIKIEVTFYRTAYQLLTIYAVLTIAGTVAYVISGMTFFESVNHVMTTVATGGMSTYDAGYPVIFSRAPLTYIPVFIFMILGGMNFYDLFNLLSGRLGALARSEEFKYYVATLMVIPTMTFLSYLLVEGHTDFFYALYASFFNAVSGITTTGFNIGSIAELSDTTKAILIVGMYIGSMTFSTAGGIKAFRLMLILKKIKNTAQSMVSPTSMVRPISVGGRGGSESDISNAFLFSFIYLFAVVVGAIIISAFGYSFTDSLFEATSAASCVGLSAGIVSPLAPPAVKLTLMALMLLGRIEYLQLFLLMSVVLSRRTIVLMKR